MRYVEEKSKNEEPIKRYGARIRSYNPQTIVSESMLS